MPHFSTSITSKIKKLRSLFLSKRKIRSFPAYVDTSSNGLLKDDDDDATTIQGQNESMSIPKVNIPVLLLRSVTKSRVEVVGDNLDSILPLISEDISRTILNPDVFIIHSDNLYKLGRAIGKIASGINQLWLDTRGNFDFARGLVEQYAEHSTSHRFAITQLTVVRNASDAHLDTISRLILLTRQKLQSVRLRRIVISKSDTAGFLWSSISQCMQLTDLEYEPRKTDMISRQLIIDALYGKKVDSLMLANVMDLCVSDLISIASSNGLSMLRVKGNLLGPNELAEQTQFDSTLNNLDNLLIHMDVEFSLTCPRERRNLLILMKSLKESAVLEVIQIAPECPVEIAKVISYWLHLAEETNRQVLLKLDGIAQDLQDAAVGRLMRKVESVKITNWCKKSMSFTNKAGMVTLLDTKSWITSS